MITRYDPEWQRAIATATLAGVTFEQSTYRSYAGTARRLSARRIEWYVKMPNGYVFIAGSMYQGAVYAMRLLGDNYAGRT